MSRPAGPSPRSPSSWPSPRAKSSRPARCAATCGWPASSAESSPPGHRLGVAGRGTAERLRSDEVERRLDRELVKPVGIGGKIRCPQGIEKKEGENFTCEVTLGDRTEKVQVIQRDDEGRLSFKPLPSSK